MLIQAQSLSILIIIKFIFGFMKGDQDPFIIIKNYPWQDKYLQLPMLKKRKPTTNSWTDQEQFQYIKFFQQNFSIVATQASRKAHKIFVKMSAYIPTRTPSQIKSHHQKLMGKFKSLPNVLRELSFYLSTLQQKQVVSESSSCKTNCTNNFQSLSLKDFYFQYNQEKQYQQKQNLMSQEKHCDEEIFKVLNNLTAFNSPFSQEE